MRMMFASIVAFTLVGAANAQKITPREVIANMEATWARTDSYTCREDAWTKAGDTEKTQAFDFSFKKPRLIRLKVQADRHKGAAVVYRDGKIRAAERILGIRMKKGMSPKDDDFYSARKVAFWEVDLGSEIAGIKTLLAGADASTVRARIGADTVVYLTFKWKGADPRLKQGTHAYVVTYKLDAKSWFPLERATTEDGAKVEDIRRTSVNLHANLNDANFNL